MSARIKVKNVIYKSDIPDRSDIETPKQLCRFSN